MIGGEKMNYGYDYNYSYNYSGELPEEAGVLLLVIGLVAMVAGIFTIVCQWKLFKKAGKPGWASIVPIYNFVVMLDIAKLPTWNIILFLIPFANIYIMFKLYIEMAHRFGKSTAYGLGLIFLPLIFLPMLAFGKAQYEDQVQNYNAYNQPVYNNQPMNNGQMYYNNQPQPMNTMPQQGFTTDAQSLNYNQQAPVNPQPLATVYCPQCGQPMAADALFCSACGYRR